MIIPKGPKPFTRKQHSPQLVRMKMLDKHDPSIPSYALPPIQSPLIDALTTRLKPFQEEIMLTTVPKISITSQTYSGKSWAACVMMQQSIENNLRGVACPGVTVITGSIYRGGKRGQIDDEALFQARLSKWSKSTDYMVKWIEPKDDQEQQKIKIHRTWENRGAMIVGANEFVKLSELYRYKLIRERIVVMDGIHDQLMTNIPDSVKGIKAMKLIAFSSLQNKRSTDFEEKLGMTGNVISSDVDLKISNVDFIKTNNIQSTITTILPTLTTEPYRVGIIAASNNQAQEIEPWLKSYADQNGLFYDSYLNYLEPLSLAKRYGHHLYGSKNALFLIRNIAMTAPLPVTCLIHLGVLNDFVYSAVKPCMVEGGSVRNIVLGGEGELKTLEYKGIEVNKVLIN